MSKIIIKIFLRNVAKQPCFFDVGIFEWVCRVTANKHCFKDGPSLNHKIDSPCTSESLSRGNFAYWVRLSADNIDMQKINP